MELQDIGNYKETFQNIIESIQFFEDNIKNTIFEKDDDESYEEAFKRGESLFDKLDEMIHNLDDVMHYKDNIVEFLKRCEENMRVMNISKNELINKILRFKKEFATKEEYLSYREEMNSKRKESPDERNRRECCEMLEDIKENVEEMKKQRNEFNKEEIK